MAIIIDQGWLLFGGLVTMKLYVGKFNPDQSFWLFPEAGMHKCPYQRRGVLISEVVLYSFLAIYKYVTDSS